VFSNASNLCPLEGLNKTHRIFLNAYSTTLAKIPKDASEASIIFALISMVCIVIFAKRFFITLFLLYYFVNERDGGKDNMLKVPSMLIKSYAN